MLGAAACLACAAFAQAQTLQVSLTPSDHNGYHISCFGRKDGAIDATVSGGTEPYSYAWTNGADTEDITGLPSGYYKLVVTDALNESVSAEITLLEPLAIQLQVDAYKYPNGKNISCHECFNGSIDVTVTGGVSPYSYDWGDGATTQDRTGLGAMGYQVSATDANGCGARSDHIALSQPERDDWTMGGNAGTNPALQYLGTSDATDVVFRSNGMERLRLLSNGGVKLTSPQAALGGLLYLDAAGILRGGGFLPDLPPKPAGLPCYNLDQFPPFWETRGNDFQDLCTEDMPRLGTRSEHNLYIITGGEERMVINTHGKVGIGTAPPAGPVNGYRLYVGDGIATNDVLVKTGPWPDYVFGDGYPLMPLPELRGYVQRNHHLPGMPSACEVEAKGGVEVGDLQRRLLETVEQQALYILQLEERLGRMERDLRQMAAAHEQRLVTPETSK